MSALSRDFFPFDSGKVGVVGWPARSDDGGRCARTVVRGNTKGLNVVLGLVLTMVLDYMYM